MLRHVGCCWLKLENGQRHVAMFGRGVKQILRVYTSERNIPGQKNQSFTKRPNSFKNAGTYYCKNHYYDSESGHCKIKYDFNQFLNVLPSEKDGELKN